MSKLENKIALVTGASKGIGASIARHLAAAGATVVVNYATSKEGADKTVEAITAAGGKAISLQGDFAKPEGVAQTFGEIKKLYGRLDVLVNNAGVYTFGPVESATVEEFHRQFNLNVLGILLATKEAIALMTDGGSIINVGSVVGSMPPPMSSIYSATKGAVDALTVSLSKELGSRNIRVNGLNPGLTATEGVVSLGAMDGDFLARVVSQTPLGRVGQPDDIGPVAVFLASEDAHWVTGQKLLVSGGQTH